MAMSMNRHVITPAEAGAEGNAQLPSSALLPSTSCSNFSMSSSVLANIIANPDFHDYLAILKGARNGLVYGVKVRFPHALIMAILFGRGE
jgi:hypothetical protein